MTQGLHSFPWGASEKNVLLADGQKQAPQPDNTTHLRTHTEMLCLPLMTTGLDSSASKAWVLKLCQLRAGLLHKCMCHGQIFSLWVWTHIDIQAPQFIPCRETLPNIALLLWEWLLRSLLRQQTLISRLLSLPVSWAPLYRTGCSHTSQPPSLQRKVSSTMGSPSVLPWGLPLQMWIIQRERERERPSVTKSMSNKC